MSYALGQIDPAPPPMRPVSWPTIFGWAAVVGVALAVFNGTVNMRANRRRRGSRRNGRKKKPRFDWLAHQRAEDEARRAAVAPVSDEQYAAEMRRMAEEADERRKKKAKRNGAPAAFAWDRRRTPTQVRTSFLFTEGDYGYYYDASGKIRRMKIAAVPQTDAYKRYLSESRAARGLPDYRGSRWTKNAGRRSSHARPKPPKMSELGVWDAVGVVREARPREHLQVLPPGVAAKFKHLAPGLYKYGHGAKGEAIVRFKNATLKGAMTSTRIGASKVGTYHWLIDNFDPNFPVVIRGIDDHGRSYFRIEEYAKNFEKVPVLAHRKSASRS
jgi:hypothetical protein